MVSSPYMKDGRLEDVIALVQVLGLDEEVHRNENSLQKELQRKPKSCGKWTELAKQHQEFFRIFKGERESVSLIARHFHGSEDDEDDEKGEVKSPRLSPDHVLTLVSAAIATYSAQIQKAQIKRTGLTIAGVLAGVGVLFEVTKKIMEHYKF